LGKARRASPDAEPGATRDELGAIFHLTVVGADLPVVPSRSGLDNLELRVEREGHASVFESDVPIGLWVVHLRDNYVNPAGRKGGSVWEMFWRPLATRSGSGGTELSWSKPPTTSTMSFGRGIADGYQRAYFWSEGSEGCVLCWFLGSQSL